ncbi:MAG: Flp family type IVb pilin [Actinobacteria bacterium]|nr:Flp family type IVb pilin [Actinomycetota bacterium]
MNKLLRLYVKLKCRVEGATAIEYAILVTLIAIAIIGAVTLIRDAMIDAYTKAATALTNSP